MTNLKKIIMDTTSRDTEYLDSDLESLCISTWNVRGLRNNNKLKAVFKSLKELDLDVIALQETHIVKHDFPKIEAKWDGPCFFSEGSRNSKGMHLIWEISKK